MRQDTIKNAVKVINREIKLYQKKLTYQLELRAETKLKNGNLELDSRFGDYESNIKKYEIILADLATIKRAIKNNRKMVKTIGSAERRDLIYPETLITVRRAGFTILITGEIYQCSYD